LAEEPSGCSSIALRSGRLWVEKVKIETTRALDLAQARDDDVVGILAGRIADLRSDPELLAAYEPLFSDLRKKIGADARSGDDGPVDTRQIGTVDHLAACLEASLEMVVTLFAEGSVRIDRLDFKRFGCFTDCTLDLSGPGTHLVVGLNEAGKTTGMAAIRQLLFGIPMRSPHARGGCSLCRHGAFPSSGPGCRRGVSRPRWRRLRVD
jgi:hypothetical protein